MVTVQPYAPQYQQGVLDVIIPIQRDEFAIPLTLEAQPDLTNIPNFYQRGQGNFWIALEGDEVIGTVALIDIDGKQAAMRKMFVKAAYRGKEKGVAKNLLEALLAWARQKKFREIYLGTTAAYHAAHRFYAKNGFEEIPKSALPVHFPIINADTKFYKRKVD